MHKPRLATVLASCAAMSIALAACSSGDAGAPTSSSPSASASATENPYGSPPPVDPPAPNETVLTLEPTNGAPVELSLEQLAQLEQQVITIEEPFVKQRQTFQGVPLKVLLAKAGIPESADIDTIALNDYTYTAPAADFVGSDAIMAYKVDDREIGLAEGGPIRIVFPGGTPQYGNLDAWTWSMATIKQTAQQ